VLDAAEEAPLSVQAQVRLRTPADFLVCGVR